MAIADHGPIQNWEIRPETKNGETKEFADKYLIPYLKVTKICGYEKTGDCEFPIANLNDRANPNPAGASWYKISLSDGSSIYLKTKNDEIDRGAYGKLQRSYIDVIIDINGKRGPNVYGRDVFEYMYWIKCGEDSGKFLPNAGYDDREKYKSLSCNKNGVGVHCAGLIMVDGWQIKDDYPW